MEHERTSLWAGLAVGMSTLCAMGLFGVVMYLLLRKSGSGSALEAASSYPMLSPGDLVPSMPVARMPNLPPSTSAGRGTSYATTMNTYTLSNTRVSKLFTAVGTRHWLVAIREAGQPGSFAFVGSDPSSVMSDSGWGVNIIPAGEVASIRLRPGDSLYARGNVNGVLVSMTAHEDDD